MGQHDTGEYFTDTEVAKMLGKHPQSVRRWRSWNNKAGCIKYGPPYEIHDGRVLYPVDKFRTWAGHVTMINGVPHMNMSVAVPTELPEGADELAFEDAHGD